jgi:hypothetical protein
MPPNVFHTDRPPLGDARVHGDRGGADLPTARFAVQKNYGGIGHCKDDIPRELSCTVEFALCRNSACDQVAVDLGGHLADRE